MTSPTPHFDRSKPFYPLVMNYLVQIFGFKELAVRGLLGARQIGVEDLQKAQEPFAFDTTNLAAIESALGGIKKLNGPLELKSEFRNDRIIADANVVAQELIGNHEYLLSFYLRAASNIFVLAHEITKNAPYRDKGSLWEFLRHSRNAATHNGLFHFDQREPKHPAEWGAFRIESSLQGTPLLKDASGRGLLSPGAPLWLLWDIEQAYPNMCV